MVKSLTCNPKALGISLAFIFSFYMLLLSLGGLAGFWTEAVATMAEFHLFYSLSIVGIIAGIIEAAIFGLITGYIGAWVYNKYS